MTYSVGIDLGSSSVKLSLIDEGGRLVRTAERAYRVAFPQEGWKEIDPELWWSATREGLRELLGSGEGASAEAAEVAAIGVTGQMHTTVFVDAAGRSVRPALMWNDTRTSELVAPAKQALSEAGEAYLAQIVSTGSPALNLQWLHENEPESFDRMTTFLIGPDWIVFKLTGTRGTDFCEASTSSLFDLSAERWSETAREIFDLPEGIYPTVRGSAQVAGTVRPVVACELGLPEDAVVIVGTGDNPAAAIPTGCLTQSKPVLSLGTSGVLMSTRPAPDYTAKGKNILLSLDGKTCLTLVQGAVQSCGSSRAWWDMDIMRYATHTEGDEGIDLGNLGRNHVMFYPHLVGEKTIYADASLRGAFIGLSIDTTRADMGQALMEGIAFAVRQLSEEMGLDLTSLDALQVIGGGSKSTAWMQILADVLHVRTLQMRGEASAGYGMALLALCTATGRELDELCDGATTVGATFEVQPDAAARYDAQYERYLRIHDALKAIDG